MLKKSNFKAKAKLFYLFIILSVISLFWIISSLNLGKIFDTEKQELQSFAISFSSPSQLFDKGDAAPFRSISSKDFVPFTLNLANSIWDGVVKKDNPNLKEIKIFIKFKHLEKILKDREKALINNINQASENVPCKVSDGVNIFKCKVKLKGNRSDHWTSVKRMSLRINVKGGYIHGMKEFAIQKPGSRQFPYDAAFHNINNELGRLSTSGQDFFKIALNGESWGVMNAEPVIDEKFLELQEVKRLGIFRISNEERSAYFRKFNDGRYLEYYISDPSVTINIKGKENEIIQDPILNEVYSNIHLSMSNKDGSIFNRQKMVANLALSLVWGSIHTLGPRNMWLTWNQYDQKLEPILTDQAPWSDTKSYINSFSILPYAYEIIFSNKPLEEEEFLNELEHLNNYFAENNPIEAINVLKDEYFLNDQRFSKTPIFSNLLFLKENVSEVVKKINAVSATSSNIDQKQKKISIDQLKKVDKVSEIFHFSDGTVRVFNLLGDDITVESIITDEKEISINKIIPFSKEKSISSVDIKTDLLGNYTEAVSVKFNINGEKKINKNTYSFNYINLKQEMPSHAENYCRNNGLINECSLTGNLSFNENKIFKYKTVIEPGTTILLQPGVNLIFDDSVAMNGTKKEPINIIGNGGIFIKNKKGKISIIQNTNFSDLATVDSLLRRFTGSINGYGGIFNLKNVYIKNGRAEDQLNIVDAKVDISGLDIIDAPSDAFDCDFCIGIIENINLSNVGGDGLDISGSNLKISKMNASNIKDKAFSVGERSFAVIDEASYENVATGIAVKDSSQVSASNITLKNIEYDLFMTYVKKPFYKGSTKLEVRDYVVNGDMLANICVREDGTDLIINDKNCEISKINIDELYLGRMKK
tara:strand:+ start:2837 stop:5461 length:2625 start_codon:yes stop_codon:yes gene_type:complete